MNPTWKAVERKRLNAGDCPTDEMKTLVGKELIDQPERVTALITTNSTGAL